MLIRQRPTKKSSVLRLIKSSLMSNSRFLIVCVLVTCNTSLGQPPVCISCNWMEFLRILDNSPRKHTPAFTIRYHSIGSLSDPRLDIQTASHFLHSSLVGQLYAKGVYLYRFVTKSNQECTVYSLKCIQQFL